MLQINQLTKRYGKTIANDQISITIADHSVTLLVGPNGAGKSTLLKSIMGLLRYQGEILIDGLSNKSVEGRAKLGYVPEIPQLYPLLTVREHLELIARIYKLKDWEGRADEWLRRFELLDQEKKLGSELSKGMQQKTSICMALLHEPEFILFDEPLVGLDPHAIKEVKTILRELAMQGKSIFVSTHILDSVDELWNYVFIMKDARIIAGENRQELENKAWTLEDFFFLVTEGRTVLRQPEPPANACTEQTMTQPESPAREWTDGEDEA